MATKKQAVKSKAKTKAPVQRASKKGGLVEKRHFVIDNFVTKGLTRPEAVAGLQKKYPDMSVNYARTIVYSQLKDEKWKEAPRQAPVKKAAVKSSKPVPKSTKKGLKKKNEPEEVDEEEDETEDESDEDESEGGDEGGDDEEFDF